MNMYIIISHDINIKLLVILVNATLLGYIYNCMQAVFPSDRMDIEYLEHEYECVG